ncbi:hypothetical protein Pyn_09898 [Prunus yedoensis var. nudiflora]|uniref:Uncharacterized protein n=1 Tax=Prunus yedoensis var. nudiflora TaxID=2094558 RepID=A0A314XVU4_PRUYE|nr:hypothetical protein Pyn_09898 [Prunus yedoensis var. nudiflora]
MGLSLTQTERASLVQAQAWTLEPKRRRRGRGRGQASSSTSIWGFAFFSSSLLNVPWLRFCPSLWGMQPRVPSSLLQWVNSHT